MLISRYIFWSFLGLSLLIIGFYQWGMRHNLKLCRLWAQTLEEILTPQTKKYTWLGGVIGFSAEYSNPSFKKIKAVLRLIPRQSLFYLPIALLTGRRDTLQLLFYLPYKVKEEIHLIKKRLYMPHVENQDQFQKREFALKGNSFILLSQQSLCQAKFFQLLSPQIMRDLNHLALTKRHNVFYIEITASNPGQAKDTICLLAKKFSKGNI